MSKQVQAMHHNLQELAEKYKRWVIANPNQVGDAESVLKWCSYLVSGYVKDSALLSEFLFSLANLVSFVNDRILGDDVVSLRSKHYSWIEKSLSVIESTEVFLELAGFRFGGPVGKWCIIVSIQVVKTMFRLILLLRDKKTMLTTPPIPPLDRSQIQKPQMNPQHREASTLTFKLQRSGRVIRKLEGAPPISIRDWRLPRLSSATDISGPFSKLEGLRLVAEATYILQPLTHLVALGMFGEKSWKPFLLSLAMDASSQGIHVQCGKGQLTVSESKELVRRRLNLFNYLLRSPFYDTRSKVLLIYLLNLLHKNLPIGSTLAGALLRYLPEYQKIYFYVWGQ